MIAGRRVLLAVAAITLAGFILRLHLFGQSLVGDELSTLWIVENHGLWETVDVVASDAEITPPLSFILSWFSTRLGSAPELVRLPALLAGTASIPLMYLLGRWTVGRLAGILGAAVFALGPFMTYFAANGRGYALLILLLLGSTLAMLRAARTGATGWWVAYGLLSCAAMYTHYTAAFVLLGQLGWLLVTRREKWRPALLANLGAAALYLPWLPGLMADLDSPTTPVLEALQGSGFAAKRTAVEQWLVGHPLIEPAAMPGNVILVVVAAGLLLAAGLTAVTLWRRREADPSREERPPGSPVRHGLALLLAIALAAPVLELVLLIFGTDLFGSRNMTASWYGMAAAAGALIAIPGGVATIVSGVLVLGGYGAAAVKLWGPDGRAVDFKASARMIDAQSRPGEPVVDLFSALVTPVPLTPLQVHLAGDNPYFALNLPDGPPPFLPYDPPVPPPETELRKAFRLAGDGRVFVLTPRELSVVESPGGVDAPRQASLIGATVTLPPGARVLEERHFPSLHSSRVYVVEAGR